MKENPYGDERINWIKHKVESIFSVEFDQNSQETSIVLSRHNGKRVDLPHVKDVFLDCLERNEFQNYNKLLAYMQDSHASSALVFWFERQQKKLDVLVDEGSLESFGDDKLESGKSSVVKRTDSYNRKSRAASTYASQASMLSDSAQVAVPEVSVWEDPLLPLPPKQVNVQVGYESLVLHMAVEIMPENLAESNAMYMLRNSPGAIPQFPSATGNLKLTVSCK